MDSIQLFKQYASRALRKLIQKLGHVIFYCHSDMVNLNAIERLKVYQANPCIGMIVLVYSTILIQLYLETYSYKG